MTAGADHAVSVHVVGGGEVGVDVGLEVVKHSRIKVCEDDGRSWMECTVGMRHLQ